MFASTIFKLVNSGTANNRPTMPHVQPQYARNTSNRLESTFSCLPVKPYPSRSIHSTRFNTSSDPIPTAIQGFSIATMRRQWAV